MSELSVGQKCTALLIIALSEGTRPVIIDQPEDALDITTVWEDVAKKLRQCKENRQFILTTHNPSVAVSADSDMFIVVKSNAHQANIKCWGAIEHPDVKKAVIQHLEGGNEPIPDIYGEPGMPEQLTVKEGKRDVGSRTHSSYSEAGEPITWGRGERYGVCSTGNFRRT